MDARSLKQERHGTSPVEKAASRQRRGGLLPALLAGGACSFAGTSAFAIQLSEIEVQSSLGQPLRASIAYALSPNEQLHDYCIFLKPGLTANGLPALSRARLTVANGRINIAGSMPIREPMLTLGLSVDCPYTANLTRSYTLMLDPFQPAPLAARAPIQETVSARPPVAGERRPNSILRRDDSPIALSGSYRVQVGDSLSTIASRIDNRPVGLWQAVDTLFNANPDAFIDGDMNKLKAGSLLTIPSFDGATAPVVNAMTETAATSVAGPGLAAASEADSSVAYPGFESSETTTGAVVEPAADTASAETAPDTAATEAAAVGERTTAVSDQTEDLRPGDVRIGNDRAFVSPIDSPIESPSQPSMDSAITANDSPEAIVDIADTSIELPGNALEPASNSLGATDPGVADNSSYRLLYWLAGAGSALLLALIVFGRRLRGRSGAPAAAAVSGTATADDEATARNQAIPDVDYDIGAQATTEHAVSLDADLSAGTGLRDTADVEVAQDFGFSTTHDLGSKIDHLFPATISDDADKPSTDIIPPQRVEEHTILEHEVLPSDDEYDLSMIVDATKQKFADGDVTAKDLMAVAVAEELDGEGGDEYTLSREVDYKILEQDYEDELTATQALNAEIARAAVELADRLDEPGADDTLEMTKGTQDDLDVTSERTAEFFSGDDDQTEILTDLDDTGINEELTAEMPMGDGGDAIESTFEGTVEMPARSGAARDLLAETGATTELTEQLPAAENDPTVEMDVESGRFSTKKTAG